MCVRLLLSRPLKRRDTHSQFVIHIARRGKRSLLFFTLASTLLMLFRQIRLSVPATICAPARVLFYSFLMFFLFLRMRKFFIKVTIFLRHDILIFFILLKNIFIFAGPFNFRTSGFPYHPNNICSAVALWCFLFNEGSCSFGLTLFGEHQPAYIH